MSYVAVDGKSRRSPAGPSLPHPNAVIRPARRFARDWVGSGRVRHLTTRRDDMSKYLVKGNYVGDGVKGLMQEGGSRRRDAAAVAIESVGGSLDWFYFAFGDTDVLGICDFPDEASATTASLAIPATGAVSVTLTPLMTPEDVDAAAAKTPAYRPPGG
jgi:uncharacterized protein with GYD domain